VCLDELLAARQQQQQQQQQQEPEAKFSAATWQVGEQLQP
jgi:hypothetical protein